MARVHGAIARDHAPAKRARSAKAARKATPGSTPIIIFTGERHDNHYEVLVHGKKVYLSYTTLNALIVLVIARAGAQPGFLSANPVTINRLRQAMDRAVAPGTGKRLIETGSGCEYRLTFGRHEMRSQVRVEPLFSDLEPLKVVSRERAKNLLRVLSSAEILLKSERYPK